MKKIKTLTVLIFLLLLVFVACKKDKVVDRRPDFLGTWTGTLSQRFPYLGSVVIDSTVQIISVIATTTDKILIEGLNGSNPPSAVVDGNTFVLEEWGGYQTVNNQTLTLKIRGSGFIENDIINESGNIVYSIGSEMLSGVWSAKLYRKN